MRRFAEDTSVPVSRTRGEIEDLLRSWGCTKLGWHDEYDLRRATLQFVWMHEGTQYIARFTVQLEMREEVAKKVKSSQRYTWHTPSTGAVDNAMAQSERSAFRVLLLWLKGALNAVKNGIVTAEAVFLPWIVTPDGRTVAEALAPHLRDLLTTAPERLLPAPGEK